ncbi:Aminomethyltransferase (glycine cleavage system T protein) [Prochlorococcus sp. MIT 0602]|nr:Aminomethyltransferase (glycine cleavage system T protein) [Prochlorococcus sp. MIT 0602]KGG16043.1 Aminomethyltransferase (glycine cleavage system T protein) [Prochlorococcus sp. MIT 0603]
MVEFSGWRMPIQFSGLINEHYSVRNHSGMFDISHMGVFLIKGINPKDALQKLVPSDLYRIGPGEACYTLLLNQAGGIIDDLIVYDLGTDEDNKEQILIVINAACIDADISWIKKNLNESNVEITNAKKNSVLIAIQGPESQNQLSKALDQRICSIPRFGHKVIQYKLNKNEPVESIFIARTGYTGEDGYEILLKQDPGIKLWCKLIENGVMPCGLGARDTLRLEAAMPLYGNDINQNTTPFEAGLGWLVHLETPGDFIGKQALMKQSQVGIKKKLIGLQLEEKAIPRKNYPITHDGQLISQITSGSWSPTLKKGIALAYLPIELAKLGTKVNIKIRNQMHLATVIKKPFYRRVS